MTSQLESSMHEEVAAAPNPRIEGRSHSILRLAERVGALAELRVPVLILGEPGTGRRHLARSLYSLADRPRNDLVSIKHPPTSSWASSVAANKSLLLAEVDLWPVAEQARLVGVLDRIDREHAEAPWRVIATATLGLARTGFADRFDNELAQKLGRFVLEIPPLRERREDIPLLAQSFARASATRLRGAVGELTAGAAALLAAQTWPGNVRELAATVDKLVAYSKDRRITRSQVRAILDEVPEGVHSSRRLQLQRQREELAALIDATGGNLAEVARRLRMSRGGVIYRAQKFGLLPRRA